MVKTTKRDMTSFMPEQMVLLEYIYQLNIDTSIKLRQKQPCFDCGNDEIAWNQGARNIKFFPDAGSITRNQNNDITGFKI